MPSFLCIHRQFYRSAKPAYSRTFLYHAILCPVHNPFSGHLYGPKGDLCRFFPVAWLPKAHQPQIPEESKKQNIRRSIMDPCGKPVPESVDLPADTGLVLRVFLRSQAA